MNNGFGVITSEFGGSLNVVYAGKGSSLNNVVTILKSIRKDDTLKPVYLSKDQYDQYKNDILGLREILQ